MATTVKTAISLPKDAFQRLESIRKRTRQSRSRILLTAFRAWLRLMEQEALEQRYTAGYVRQPELAADVEGFYRAGLAALGEDQW
jgi:metal-responsive CopG/Arc/MetJ family transcriptional regulator